jgi:hypothetical protein
VVSAAGAFFARVAFFFAAGSNDATSGDCGATGEETAGSVDSGMTASGCSQLRQRGRVAKAFRVGDSFGFLRRGVDRDVVGFIFNLLARRLPRSRH